MSRNWHTLALEREKMEYFGIFCTTVCSTLVEWLLTDCSDCVLLLIYSVHCTFVQPCFNFYALKPLLTVLHSLNMNFYQVGHSSSLSSCNRRLTVSLLCTMISLCIPAVLIMVLHSLLFSQKLFNPYIFSSIIWRIRRAMVLAPVSALVI